MYVLLPVCLAMALSVIGAIFDGPGTMMAILFFGVAVIWITVALFGTFGIESMPITGLAINRRTVRGHARRRTHGLGGGSAVASEVDQPPHGEPLWM
ncbi:MAG: hypothetical protein ABI277_02140 [Burkholderiaceae bacterium]